MHELTAASENPYRSPSLECPRPVAAADLPRVLWWMFGAMYGLWAFFFAAYPLAEALAEEVSLPSGVKEAATLVYILFAIGATLFALFLTAAVAVGSIWHKRWLILLLSIPALLVAAMVCVIGVLLVSDAFGVRVWIATS